MKKKQIKPTLTTGVAKVPVVMQLETLECGAAALCMVMAYYGKWVPLEQTRLDCGVSRDGIKAKNIYLAAEHYGFSVNAYQMTAEELRDDGQYPCILYWNHNHFVVLDGFKGKWVWLNDPARGEVRVNWEEFKRSFSEVAIIPVPSERFEPGGKRRSTLDFARRRLIGAGAAVAFTMLVTAISYLCGNPDESGRTEAFVMQELLTERGVSAERMSLEDQAASTRENFRNTAQLIDPSRPVVFISSDYHMDRAVSMAKEAGFTQVMRLPAPSDPIRYGANVMWEVILEINELKSVLAK